MVRVCKSAETHNEVTDVWLELVVDVHEILFVDASRVVVAMRLVVLLRFVGSSCAVSSRCCRVGRVVVVRLVLGLVVWHCGCSRIG